MNTTLRTKTPCIGICSTTSVGDPIWRGCKRFAFEVINWNSYSDQEKLAVLERLEALVVQILSERFHVRNPVLLQQQMQGVAVPYDPARSPYTWLHNLLKKQHRQIHDLEQFGVAVREAYADVGLAALIEEVDQQLLQLCDAHRQRYFPGL